MPAIDPVIAAMILFLVFHVRISPSINNPRKNHPRIDENIILAGNVVVRNSLIMNKPQYGLTRIDTSNTVIRNGRIRPSKNKPRIIVVLVIPIP